MCEHFGEHNVQSKLKLNALDSEYIFKLVKQLIAK